MTILDTNVLSELLATKRPSTIDDWLDPIRKENLYTKAVNQAEIPYGIAILPRGRRRRDFLTAARAMFRAQFEGRILPFDELAADHYVNIVATRKYGGRPIQIMDAQIAAIARARGMTLATRNMKDFVDCEVELINPWSFDAK
jgi:predicted nucleic acid-binding protein